MKKAVLFLIAIAILFGTFFYFKVENDKKVFLEQERLKEEARLKLEAYNKCMSEEYDYNYDFSVVSNLGENYTFFYKDLTEDKLVISKRMDHVYYAASVLKLPFAIYIYDLLKEDIDEFDKVIPYHPRNTAGGSGIIQFMSDKSNLTLQFLLNHSVEDSDNIAYKMLVENYSTIEAKEFWEEKGTKNSFNGWDIFGLLTGEDSIIYLDYLYTLKGDDYYKELFESADNAKKSSVVKDIFNTKMYFKYGLVDSVYHEIFIVDDKYAYSVGLLCDAKSFDYKTNYPLIASSIKENHDNYWNAKKEYCENPA